ncbi:MAG: DUF6314 family protein [Rickettsiaceae bacterium]|nr:DUF6314 family protein [Rickettsiaceae bacterium]MDP5020845.1 DUF6314 family protein [Rickettsiaceae bacterium]
MANLPSSNANIFKLFKGQWDLSRQVRDNSTKEITHIMKGTVNFTSLSIDHTLYEETVYIDEYSIGTKKYLLILSNTTISQYRFNPSSKLNLFPFTINHPDIIKMYELNFIQPAPLKKMIASGSYLCPPDQYDVTYTFNTETIFSTLYNIIGPHKYQTIETIYTRSEADDSSLRADTP